jgi:hypothetical protein
LRLLTSSPHRSHPKKASETYGFRNFSNTGPKIFEFTEIRTKPRAHLMATVDITSTWLLVGGVHGKIAFLKSQTKCGFGASMLQ